MHFSSPLILLQEIKLLLIMIWYHHSQDVRCWEVGLVLPKVKSPKLEVDEIYYVINWFLV
jgi:hypothetical protein